MTTHEDSRRILHDFAEGNFKCAKAIIVKDDQAAIGGHKHMNIDEEFLLVKGGFNELQIGETILTFIKAPYYVKIPRGTYHKFVCSLGSILFGVSTDNFDDNDKVK